MKIINLFKRKKVKEVKEVAFTTPSLKQRLSIIRSTPKKKYTVTVGIEYNDKVIRQFTAIAVAHGKDQACQKVGDGMKLKVLDVKRKRS